MSAAARWYFDTGALVLILITLIIAHYALAVHPLHFLSKLISEFRELLAGGRTTGAINALGLLIVALIGVLIIVANALGHLFEMAMQIFRPEKAHEYVASVSAFTLFIVIALLASLSVLLTLLAERRR